MLDHMEKTKNTDERDARTPMPVEGWTREQVDAEIARGLAELERGERIPAEEVWRELGIE